MWSSVPDSSHFITATLISVFVLPAPCSTPEDGLTEQTDSFNFNNGFTLTER